MGTFGRKIVGSGADEIIKMLNKALADEWLAYYQYWVGALVVKGPMRPEVQAELSEHANEELGHAKMLAERIIQLGGTPILNPAEWMKNSNCGYDEPKDEHVLKVLEQNIKGEQCAIETYSNMLKKIMVEKDPITFHLVRKILEDEVKHEHDLQDLEQDIKMIK
ncbi:MAG: ferritin-like domain-containing protein [Candidatus Micrarchaeota archaeon]|nr:ferritin-like domain-containing protein [Candidatus Micrarchaeota archaeon]